MTVLTRTDIEMYEVLTKPHEIVPVQPTLVSVSTIASKLKEQEVRREQRRQVQIELARKRNARLKAEAEGMVLEPSDTAPADGGKRSRTEASDRNDPAKRRKTDETRTGQATTTPRGHALTETGWVTRVISDVRGHTSYLTFATMYPRTVNEAIEKRESERAHNKKQTIRAMTTQLRSANAAAAAKQAQQASAVPGSLLTADKRGQREASVDTEVTTGSFDKGMCCCLSSWKVSRFNRLVLIFGHFL